MWPKIQRPADVAVHQLAQIARERSPDGIEQRIALGRAPDQRGVVGDDHRRAVVVRGKGRRQPSAAGDVEITRVLRSQRPVEPRGADPPVVVDEALADAHRVGAVLRTRVVEVAPQRAAEEADAVDHDARRSRARGSAIRPPRRAADRSAQAGRGRRTRGCPPRKRSDARRRSGASTRCRRARARCRLPAPARRRRPRGSQTRCARGAGR